VIDPAGRIYEARPLQYQGAHVHLQNEQNVGIVHLGNYDKQAPTRAQAAALDAFVADLMKRHRIPITRVYTHQEIGRSACPGTALQRYMVAARGVAGSMRLAASART
jgi:N-acetyl-anhydromuramyl-L-alanine amidase AmpD